ncbi:MarR family winged helix-turn-helix transcriptional regulator [Mycolicibacterium sp. CBMA 234]|uniref:MarR family winged helix-turn-helix transcriptional regulator n=1 Tax=Mycolicibacterium sp. CBMA 234 TaxID=1918495 RepID=UPI0013913953|nr:MarR family transcriptional regulator [Mycolicibacterium sp. CBMA 234]
MTVTRDRIDTIATALEQSAQLVTRRLVDRDELNMTALDALHRLSTAGATRLSTLAATVGVSQPAMTQLIQRLDRSGFVRRTVDHSDGRVSLVAITDTGQAALETQRRARRERLAEILAESLPDEQAAFELASQVALPILRRINNNDRATCPDQASA